MIDKWSAHIKLQSKPWTQTLVHDAVLSTLDFTDFDTSVD